MMSYMKPSLSNPCRWQIVEEFCSRCVPNRSGFLWPLLALFLSSCSLPDGFRVAGHMALERRRGLPMPGAGETDVSRLHDEFKPGRVLKLPSDPAKAETELRAFLAEARALKTHVTIAGARHSMGGQTLGEKGCYTVDMLDLNQVGEVFHQPGIQGKHWVTVGAGARWKDIIPKLRQAGFAPKVMQSNSDFSVGGSLSVNCHGWQHNAEPIASTVSSFRLMLADGSTRRCSRRENAELFALVLGGYGLFGVILEATLEVVPDQYYMASSKLVTPEEYVRVFEEMTQGSSDGMAYGRISTAPGSFLTEGAVVVLEPVQEAARKKKGRGSGIPGAVTLGVKRSVFRSTVGSDDAKDFRWALEKKYGETGKVAHRRSDILSEPAALYGNRNPQSTDILHEYFIPKARLAEFIGRMRLIHQSLGTACPELLNITVRNVKTDRTTYLRYARQEVFGLVMLFHQRCKDPAGEAAMMHYTQKLVDAALACEGTYYLPYRLHATPEQFRQGYPNSARFFALKNRYDPAALFQNRFYQRYGR